MTTQTQWTKIGDRLPDYHMPKLVLTTEGKVEIASLGIHKKGGKNKWNTGVGFPKTFSWVLAWTEVPAVDVDVTSEREAAVKARRAQFVESPMPGARTTKQDQTKGSLQRQYALYMQKKAERAMAAA